MDVHNLANTFKIIKIEPMTTTKKYDKLSDKTSYGLISIVETDLYTSDYNNIFNYMNDKYDANLNETMFIINNDCYYDILLTESSCICCTTRNGIELDMSLTKGIHIEKINNFSENLAKIDNINHMVSAMNQPGKYFNNKIEELYKGSCYFIRQDRKTHEYTSCETVEQFVKEYNNHTDKRRHPTQIIKDKNNNYHLRLVSYVEDFIVHDVLKLTT